MTVRANVTVAIPTRGGGPGLHRVVRDLWAGRRRPDEIVIVCQGDVAEETGRELIRAVPEASSVIRFYASTRRGTNAARNDAVRLAAGDFVAFTDDDMRLPADWLEAMLAAWKGGWNRGPVLLTGPIHPPEGVANAVAVPGVRTGDERRVWRMPPRRGDVLFGGHFGGPRGVYDRVGVPPFDERFGPGATFPGAGDEEFAIRLLRAAVPVVFEPSVRAVHVARHGEWVRSQFTHCQGTGALYMLRLASSEPAVWRSIWSTVWSLAGKGVRSASRLRLNEAAGRFAALAGMAFGAARWWVTGSQNDDPADASADEPVLVRLV